MRLFVLCAVAAALAGTAAAARPLWSQLSSDYTFDAYIADFGRTYAVGSEEYAVRKGIFEANLARILAHNADSSKTWKV